MARANNDFTGTWKCSYWFPSNRKPGTEEASTYTGKFHKKGSELVYESEPNDEGSYMFVRMTLDGDLITGNWHEHTSPDGEFEGTVYSGAFQALIDKAGKKVEGKWAGIGQERGKRKIYTGRWQFAKK